MAGKHLTISDIARAAGVSTGAASYALNNRPGVSESTRERILEVAERLGWAPNNAARSLTDGRANAIGIVLDRPARVLGIEPSVTQLISGIQDALADGPTALLLQVTDNSAAELGAYRRWWAEGRVDGVLLVDLRRHDPRVALVRELGMPAVVLGELSSGEGVPCVWTDEHAAMAEVLRYLVALGHRRIARVSGPEEFVHTRTRSEAFAAVAEQLELDEARILPADSDQAAARATRRVLTDNRPPTALVFDNDAMAVSASGVAQELGIAVPEQLSLVAWDDSALCELVRPALSAVRCPIVERGAAAVELLRETVAGAPVRAMKTSAPALIPRLTTGPAPRQ